MLVSGDTVTIDGVVIDGAMGHWTIARNGDTLWMGQAGFSWPLGIIGREAELREMLAAIETVDHPLSPEIRSPMPGTVVAVPVANGETVEAGQTVLTVEAMKMEHRLTAPVAGVVQISAIPGDLVKLDQLLASITQSIHEEKRDQEKTA